MRATLVVRVLFVVLASVLVGCQTVPTTKAQRESLHEDVLAAIGRFKAKAPSLRELFRTAYGYAVFPSVGKGAVGIGGAYGRGEVFDQEKMVGNCDLRQGTLGLALGGQVYSEIIFFERKSALDRFKTGSLEFAAQASAVAVTAGASADADYENGVVVFTMSTGGLMFEASIGGQKFTYVPK